MKSVWPVSGRLLDRAEAVAGPAPRRRSARGRPGGCPAAGARAPARPSCSPRSLGRQRLVIDGHGHHGSFGARESSASARVRAVFIGRGATKASIRPIRCRSDDRPRPTSATAAAARGPGTRACASSRSRRRTRCDWSATRRSSAGATCWSGRSSRGLRDGLVAAGAGRRRHRAPRGGAVLTLATPTQTGSSRHARPGRASEGRADAAACCARRSRTFATTGGTLVLIDHATELPPAVRGDRRRGSSCRCRTRRSWSSSCATRCGTCNDGGADRGRAQQPELADDRPQPARADARGRRGRSILDAVCDDRRFDAARHQRDPRAASAGVVQGDGLLEYVEAPVEPRRDRRAAAAEALARAAPRMRSATRRSTFGIAPPRGVLMLGVQGAGKSLVRQGRRHRVAAAAAAAWTSARCTTSYIGESERRLRDALHQAEMMAPIVLWIDEIEKALRLRRQPEHRRRAVQAHVRHAADVDAGAHGAGLPRSRPPTTSKRCRRSCCARAGSTRSSSSTCPTPRPGTRSSRST